MEISARFRNSLNKDLQPAQDLNAFKLSFFSDELAIDYQFTFNLSKSDDKHLTGINFKNTPTKMDVDVDFSITCSVPAKVGSRQGYLDNTFLLFDELVMQCS